MQQHVHARALTLSIASALVVLASSARAQTCAPGWLPTSSPPIDDVPTFESLVAFDDGAGGGEALYASGAFTSVAGVAANGVARWNGTSWSAPAGGPGAPAGSMVVFDDGSGPALYAALQSSVVKWNGSTWSAVGGPAGNPPGTARIFALSVFDDGSGERLYAAGYFVTFGGVYAPNVARWSGAAWQRLGTGSENALEFLSLAPFDDGSGSGAQLYAGFKSFGIAGGVLVLHNGAWTSLPPISGHGVTELVTFDDGSGNALYGATALGTYAVFKWDGSSVSPVGNQPLTPLVRAFVAFDDGSGAALYAGGNVAVGSSDPFNGIAKWNGVSWTALGAGTGNAVGSLAVFDDGHGNGPALFAGGSFASESGSGESRLAKWGCTLPSTFPPFCAGDGSVAPCPCGNDGAPHHGCANSVFATGAVLSGSGTASVSSDSVTLASSNLTGVACVFFQGDAEQAPVAIDDGLGCVTGSVVRLGTKPIVSSASSYPQSGDAPIGVRGALPASGATRYYQCFYRNAAVAFCPTGGSNRTNAVAATWVP